VNIVPEKKYPPSNNEKVEVEGGVTKPCGTAGVFFLPPYPLPHYVLDVGSSHQVVAAASRGTPWLTKDRAEGQKPEDTAFKQQRLKAWQPILTPYYRRNLEGQ